MTVEQPDPLNHFAPETAIRKVSSSEAAVSVAKDSYLEQGWVITMRAALIDEQVLVAVAVAVLPLSAALLTVYYYVVFN